MLKSCAVGGGGGRSSDGVGGLRYLVMDAIYARPPRTDDSGRYPPRKTSLACARLVLSVCLLSRLRERHGLPAQRRLGDALAERRCSLELAGADALVALVAIGLRHHAQRGAGAVEVVDRALGVVVARCEAEADPHHAVLLGEREELVERVLLVAAPRGRDGEACGELVLLGARHPALGRPVLELREVGRDAAHIGRRAENDRVGSVELS